MAGRTVVWQPRFEEELSLVNGGSARRMDEVMAGLDAMLSARPEMGQPVLETGLFYVAATRFGERLVFFYRFTEEQVFMESLLQLEEDDSAL